MQDDIEAEVWRTIPGLDGLYEVSNIGRVRSLPRERTNGRIRKIRLLSGYMVVYIGLGLRGKKTLLVHRLVLEAFVGPCPEGYEAAHNNGNSTDNRLENLRWATKKENGRDKIRHGTARRVGVAKQKLTADDADFVRANHKKIRQADLAAMFGVHKSTIQRIHSGERYAA